MFTTFIFAMCFRQQAFSRECHKVYSLSMITDAMSKWKTTVPHLAREPKSLDSQGNRLQYSLTASKIHGLCNVADWQYGGQFQGAGSGCNFSCSVILANLHLVEESTGEIPRHLKLQMDNCAKDNKNATVLGFCGLLVAEGVVETVEVSNNSQSQLVMIAKHLSTALLTGFSLLFFALMRV